jgi:hypothetical protein
MASLNKSQITGLVIITIGLLALLSGPQIPDRFQEVGLAVLVLLMAAAFFQIYKNNRQKQSFGILSLVLALFGIWILANSIWKLPDTFWSMLFFFILAFIFVVVYAKTPTKWWSAALSGICLTLGTVNLLNWTRLLAMEYHLVVLLLGLGLTAAYLWLQPPTLNVQRWAMILTAFFLLMAVYTLVERTVSWNTTYVWPVLFIAAGIWLLVRSFKPKRN